MTFLGIKGSFIWGLVLVLLVFSLTVTASERSRERRSRHSNIHRQQEKRTVPADWSVYVATGNDGGGCYVDQSTRILGVSLPSDRSLSISRCLSACQSQGYTYAGVEYGVQCYVSRAHHIRIDHSVLPRLPHRQRQRSLRTARIRVLGCPRRLAVLLGGSTCTSTLPLSPLSSLRLLRHSRTKAVLVMGMPALSLASRTKTKQ